MQKCTWVHTESPQLIDLIFLGPESSVKNRSVVIVFKNIFTLIHGNMQETMLKDTR